MVWLEGDETKKEPASKCFGKLLERNVILRMPGVHNALAALLAREAGFSAVYVSGGAISASMGLADIGIMTIDELCGFVRPIVRASGLPVLVDGDTGYGEIFNVMRLVRELEEAGAAAMHIEDQILPKKCGHLNNKTLISADAMASKIYAATKARAHLKIIARTDSFASEGLEGLISRSKCYLDAGADAIFPEALTSVEEFQIIAEKLDCPLLANMTEFGCTPYLTAEEFQKLGYKMLIYPVSSLRIAARAMEIFYNQLAKEGTTEPQLDKMLTRKRLYEILDYYDYEALGTDILKSQERKIF